MVEESNVHDIFLINPIELLNYVGRFVKVVLENKEIIYGTVYTIDPVSQSLVLIKNETSQEQSLKIIIKHSVNSMEIIPEVPTDQQNIKISDIFNSKQFSSSGNHSKEEVKNWLEKHMIPVVENGDRLVIDSLEIHPPYGVDQCFSSNSVVLGRIQKLLTQMPCKDS